MNLGLGGCQGNCSNIDPNIGAELGGYYFVTRDIEVGGNFRYQRYGVDAGNMYSLMLGPELKYLFAIDNKFQLIGSGGFGLDMWNFSYDSSYATASGDDKGIYIRIGTGGIYQINPDFSLGIRLTYQINFWKDSNSSFNDYFAGLTGIYNFK